MLSRTRLLLFGIGVVFVLFLLSLLIFTPPDGRERAELSQFIGRFHPLIVHLPIGLLLLVPVLECAGWTHRWAPLRASAGFVLALATVGVMTAVSLGWLLAWSGGYQGRLVTRHMWGGLSLAVAVLICCILRGWNKKVYGVVLLATLGLLGWTSDQGGKLTHGETFLTQRMPGKLRALLRLPAPAQKVQPKTGSTNAAATNIAGPAPSVTFYAARVAPIFEDKCVLCHNAEKRKGKLQLNDFGRVMRGGKDGVVVKPGDPKGSELFRRITLSAEDKDFMPAEGKPALSAGEIKVIELWIASGASNTLAAVEVRGAPPLSSPNHVPLPLTGDYRPHLKVIGSLQEVLGVRVVPRSQNPTDGLILRTVSAPERCDDAALVRLKPVANLIVDAELARTKVTDAGVRTLATFSHLRSLDLSHTAVTSAGVGVLTRLSKLERLNLTATAVDDAGIAALRHQPTLKRLYVFETHSTAESELRTKNEKR